MDSYYFSLEKCQQSHIRSNCKYSALRRHGLMHAAGTCELDSSRKANGRTRPLVPSPTRSERHPHCPNPQRRSDRLPWLTPAPQLRFFIQVPTKIRPETTYLCEKVQYTRTSGNRFKYICRPKACFAARPCRRADWSHGSASEDGRCQY